uniref:Uncharacterized protein n=1 Tax=Ditylenchus dipsaci TaxID=166011 RepID=A0A915E0N3_9BILA
MSTLPAAISSTTEEADTVSVQWTTVMSSTSSEVPASGISTTATASTVSESYSSVSTESTQTSSTDVTVESTSVLTTHKPSSTTTKLNTATILLSTTTESTSLPENAVPIPNTVGFYEGTDPLDWLKVVTKEEKAEIYRKCNMPSASFNYREEQQRIDSSLCQGRDCKEVDYFADQIDVVWMQTLPERFIKELHYPDFGIIQIKSSAIKELNRRNITIDFACLPVSSEQEMPTEFWLQNYGNVTTRPKDDGIWQECSNSDNFTSYFCVNSLPKVSTDKNIRRLAGSGVLKLDRARQETAVISEFYVRCSKHKR